MNIFSSDSDVGVTVEFYLVYARISEEEGKKSTNKRQNN